MRLFIVRHGKAEDRAAHHGADRDRRLTPRGVRQAEFLADALAPLMPQGARAAVSPVERARQTGVILCDSLGLNPDFDDRLSTSFGIEEALAVVGEARDAGTRSDTPAALFVVGHNPTLEELGWWLSPNDAQHHELRTGECVVFDLRGDLRRGCGEWVARLRLED